MNGDGQFQLETEIRDEIRSTEATVRVIGDFDRLQTGRFDQAATSLPQAIAQVVIDLTATTIIDSGALGSLVRLRHKLDEVDASLVVLVNPNFQEKVMRIAGLYEYLGVRLAD